MTDSVEDNPAGGFNPRFVLDLAKATAQRFNELTEQFEVWGASLGELPPLGLNNGWYSINQEIAEQWLLRNHKGANRKPSLGTVVYYAAQQAEEKWPQTGQAVIFTVEGVLVDGQQRLWAAYLGNTTFVTYVVADVPQIPNLFAYYDNLRVRTGATALATGGFNGLSSLINQTVQIVQSFEAGAYRARHKKRLPRLAPIDVLIYVTDHPALRRAARLAVGEYGAACEAIGHKDVVAFCVYKIAGLFDENVVEEFFGEVGDPEDLPEGSPVTALHKVLRADFKSEDPMSKHQILGYVIKAFNAWKRGDSVKKLSFRLDEDFPAFIENQDPPQEQAA